MQTLTNLRLKEDRRGVSNIIVVVLSLVIITVIASNVVLWSYQMNQLDWERIHENIEITVAGSTLTAHEEITTIGGTSYYLQKLERAEATGTSLSASMAATGRQLLGKFVYPLTGVSSIPASTWTMYYRGWRDAPSIAFDAQSSITQSTTATSISWSHTTGTGSNRLLLVAVGVHVATGTPATVSNVTYGGVSLIQVTTALYSAKDPQVRTYVFGLVNPASGTNTITVNFVAATLSVAGAVTYTGVDQTTPIQTSNTATGAGKAPSVLVTVTGGGRWLFGHLGGDEPKTWSITEGAEQTNRWAQEGQFYKGRGSDKSVSAGSQSMSWTLDKTVNYVASAVVINPATPPPVGHLDIDILVLQSNGTIRTTIATNVANSGDLTSTPTTLSGTYSWSAYTVVDQTDYLEIDYYVDVTVATSGVTAYLRIDDSSLPVADQTRVMLSLSIFTFKNKGSLTSHLVSLWVNNSTRHQRYAIDVIVNLGETLSYLSVDIRLPDGPYVVKVVTERGNIAVYSEG